METGTPAIRAAGLVKDYRAGRRRIVRALDGVDLEIARGEIFGFLGPNGSGKSTFIRLLLDLLRPTSGAVEVLGQDPRAGGAALRSRIGYLPGELTTGTKRSAGDYLEHLAELRGGRGRDQIMPLAERFGLDLSRTIRGLSKGNKQKVGIVQAFMHGPELLVLDEPTSGLDPLLQREFLALVGEHAEAGATVLMSSHVLSEVEQIARRVAIIRAGRIVDADDMTVLRRRAGQTVTATIDGSPTAAEFDGLAGVEDVELVGGQLRCRLHGPPDALLKALAGHTVSSWSATDRELEDLFLDFYRLPVDTVGQDAVGQDAVGAATHRGANRV